MSLKATTFVAALFSMGILMAEEDDRTVLKFERPEAVKEWNAVNDGVMGGHSKGRFKITDSQTLEFYGTISLANNGGFASIRSRQSELNLESADSIVLRVRGDGREYSLNLYTPVRRIAFSHRSKFTTEPGEWIEVELPVSEFEATWFGRVVQNPLDAKDVNGIGVLLGDKKSGPFKLEIDWIKIRSSGR